jgi:hypothetical protein
MADRKKVINEARAYASNLIPKAPYVNRQKNGQQHLRPERLPASDEAQASMPTRHGDSFWKNVRT